MSILALNIFCSALLILLVNSGESLRCRVGNQQTNDQLHKIMQNCRKKYSSNGSKNGNDYTTSSENDSSDEDSASSISFDEALFFGNSNKRSDGNNSRNGGNYQSSTVNYGGENRRNDRRKQDSFANRSTNPSNYSWMNERGNGMSDRNENHNYQSGIQLQNRENGNNDQREPDECVTQCFFDELNLVDQRGFPERGSIMEIMTRGIQDPSLRDFIEESISECFYYLSSDMNNREKCAFSKNLMSCFADKGRERCEDWDDH